MTIPAAPPLTIVDRHKHRATMETELAATKRLCGFTIEGARSPLPFFGARRRPVMETPSDNFRTPWLSAEMTSCYAASALVLATGRISSSSSITRSGRRAGKTTDFASGVGTTAR